MSVQVSDYVFYENKKFILIDIEKDKQLVNFIKPSFLQKILKKKEYSSCWRGYIADYFIENEILHGVKYNISLKKSGFKGIKSKKNFLNYTGSIIIAFNKDDKKWHNSDFLNSYLYYDIAYEIYLKNGVVKNINDLSSAILEYKNWYNADKIREKEKTDKNYYLKEIDNIARKYLKYEYDKRTYKWR